MTSVTGVDEELVALTPVLRQFLARRVASDRVDDLVQESLTRVLARRPRLSGEALAAYTMVTARNLVISAARSDARRGPAVELDVATTAAVDDADPLATLLTAEERDALATALSRLGEEERATVEAREEGSSTAELAKRLHTSPGAVAVRLARIRAQLRVDYAVASEGVRLPGSRCRPVLLSLSAGDRRAQRSTGAGGHLVECATCASLAPVLLERRRPVAFLLPALAGRRLLVGARRRPVLASGSAAAVVAAAVVGGLLWASAGDGAPPACPPSVRVGRSAGSVVRATQTVSVADHARLGSHSGETATGTDLPVLEVPADEGFWVGCGGGELWVRLVGEGESPEAVRPGARVDVSGRLVAHGPGFGASVGLDGDAARRLDGEGVHLEVAYADAVVQ